GIRDPGHDIGHTGTRRDDRYTEPPRRPCPAVGCVPRGLLVTGIDQPNLVVECGLENGVEMPPMEREDVADSLLFEHPNEHLSAIDLRHRHCSSHQNGMAGHAALSLWPRRD